MSAHVDAQRRAWCRRAALFACARENAGPGRRRALAGRTLACFILGLFLGSLVFSRDARAISRSAPIASRAEWSSPTSESGETLDVVDDAREAASTARRDAERSARSARQNRRPTSSTDAELGTFDDEVIDLREFREKFPPEENRAIWLTCGTMEVREAAANWLATTRKVGITARSVVVAAFDEELLKWCREEAESMKREFEWSFTCADARAALMSGKRSLKVGIDSFRENSNAFNALMRAKVKCIEVILRAGYDLAMSDVDVAWIRSPLEYYSSGQLADADVIASSDALHHFDGAAYASAERARPGSGLEYWSALKDAHGVNTFPLHLDMNVGIMYWRSTTNAIQFAIDWVRAMHLGTEVIDQIYFNTIARTRPAGLVRAFCKGPVSPEAAVACTEPMKALHLGDAWPKGPLKYGAPELDVLDIEGACAFDACERGTSDADLNGEFADAYIKGERPLYSYGGMSGSVRFAVLPTQLFANGLTYFSFGHRLSPNAYAVHNTYVYDGFAGKMWRFRESGLVVGEKKSQYLTPKGADIKVLVVRFDIPKYIEEGVLAARFTPRSEVPHGHLAALTWQMNRIRDALAVARLTKRTLIIPQFLCGCQRHFHYMNNCTVGGTPLPYACPIDHVLRPLRFEEFDIHAREASYFQNRIKTGLMPFKPAPRVAVCAQNSVDVTACATQVPRLDGLLSKTAGYVAVDTPVDAEPVASARVLRSPFTAARVRTVFASLAHEPVVVLDNLGSSGSAVDFTSFETAQENEDFDDAMRAVSHQACCFVDGVRLYLPEPLVSTA